MAGSLIARLRVALRRLLFVTLAAATTAAGVHQTAVLLAANGTSGLEIAILVLFAILFGALTMSFWTSVFGAFVRLRGGDPLDVARTIADGPRAPPLTVRTAIVLPVYNEEPGRVFAGLRATYAALQRTGQLEAFDFHVLSDTTDPDVWIAEEVELERTRALLGDPERIRYRNRPRNLERKAGNIADFCERHAADYRYMIVFDADSVMSGRTLVALVRLMEANPDVGIIQAPPVPANRQTLFGRLQQFATRAYGPIFVSGLNWWQAGDGNYWGHNAIIRIAPFMEHCRLPKLPGREPLGGSILSHDFVEAALMRRAGWKVYLAGELEGSYEETPPTLIDYAARDRRWCQGNLQHARLLATPGLALASRVHLLMGILAYAASPLWILMLALSTIEALRVQIRGHSYFPEEGALFPVWEISIVDRAALLFAVVMTMIFLPKLLSLLLKLRHRSRVARFGGALPFTASVLLESLFSVLLAPVLALLQTRFVIGTLLGQNVSWGPQERGDRGTTWGEALRRHGGTTLLGAFWGATTWTLAPELFLWLSPVLAGMVLAVPLSVVSSRATLGRKARERRLFLTPDETTPPFVLRRLHEELTAADAAGACAPPGDGLRRVLDDPGARAIHLAHLPAQEDDDPLLAHHRQGLALKARLKGIDALSRAEKRELLSSRSALTQLLEAVREEAAREPQPA